MAEIKDCQEIILKFRERRDWKQFHNPKDLSLSLVLEAGEVLEHFQWRNGDDIDKYAKTHKTEIAEELADVFYWTLLLSHDLNIDLAKAFRRKMRISEKKYPVRKSRGNAKKYTELI